MVREAALLDGLLGDAVACGEEDGGCDGLGEEGPRREAGLIPVKLLVSEIWGLISRISISSESR